MTENSSWLIPDNKYRILFRYHLLDENNSLRLDTMQRLENILAKRRRFIIVLFSLLHYCENLQICAERPVRPANL
jgi:hypothetical protein